MWGFICFTLWFVFTEASRPHLTYRGWVLTCNIIALLAIGNYALCIAGQP